MSYGTLREHLVELRAALCELEQQSPQIDRWGADLGLVLAGGGRVLVTGNGGSAAQAQHLTAELVGRFADSNRRPLSAIALHVDTSTVTAVGNDYGFEQVYARQVHAHGRPGDVLILLSTSGSSPNLIAAAEAARQVGVSVWAATGPGPNPLTRVSDRHIAISAGVSTVQEAHLTLIHAVCAALERYLPDQPPAVPGARRPADEHAGGGKVRLGARLKR